MVVYYSWHGATQSYAYSLAKRLQVRCFRLEEQKPREGKLAFFKAGGAAVFKREAPVKEMPKLDKVQEITIASPVWASAIVPAMRHFLNHAELKGKKVNVLLTCGKKENHESFRKGVEAAITAAGATMGGYHVFSTPRKEKLDSEKVKDQIKTMVL